MMEEFVEKKLTDWPNEPTQADLDKDFKEADTAHSSFMAKLEEWKINMEGGKPVRARRGKSTIRPRLIRKQAEWKYPALEEPFLNTEDMFDIKPRTAEDIQAAQQNKIMLNYYWATKVDKVKLVGDIVRTIVNEGTVIVKTGWYAEEIIEVVQEEHPIYASPEESLQLMQDMVQAGQMDEATAQAMLQTGEPVQIGSELIEVERPKLIENYPTYEVCDNSNIIVDPTCDGNIADARFIIHEYETDMATLKRNEYKIDQDGNESGIYHNLDTIDFNADNAGYDEYTPETKSSFRFNDKARKKIKAYEYWGEWDINNDGHLVSIVATWIGTTMVRLEKNPFPHGKLPFSVATYMPKKKEFYGEPDAELLIENQESIGKMTRAAHDITTTQAIGQRLVSEALFSNPSQWDEFRKGNDARFSPNADPRTAIYKENVDSISPSVFQMIDMNVQDAESLSGTQSFARSGISGAAFGSTATGVRSAMDATAKRELSILRRLSDQLFKPMASMTVINMQAYVDEEETIRITSGEFVAIRREDLKGEFDLKIDVSTPEKDNETAQDLGMVLQTNAAHMDPKLAAIVLAKIMTLKKQPDLAKQILEFEPQPSEAEIAMQDMQMKTMQMEQDKLELEIAVLAKSMEEADSRIAERATRAQENGVDIKNKEAQAAWRMAQTEKLLSETDKLDQEFLDKHSGAARQRELEDKDIDRLATMDREAMKLLHTQKSKD